MNLRIVVRLLLVCVLMTGGTRPFVASAAGKDLPEKLEITTSGANVTIAFSEDNQFSYDYSSSKFIVTADRSDNTEKIKISKKNNVQTGLEDHVTVYVPDVSYRSLKAVAEKGALTIPAIDADMTVINNSGAVSLNLSSDFSKTVSCTAASGAVAVNMNGNTEFSINAVITKCAVSVPDNWPAYNNGANEYGYRNGDGTVKIDCRLKDSAVSFRK